MAKQNITSEQANPNEQSQIPAMLNESEAQNLFNQNNTIPADQLQEQQYI